MPLFRRRAQSAVSARPPSVPEAHSLLDSDVTETRLLRLFADPSILADITQFDTLAREGYRACAIVRACVDEIADSISEPRLLVERARAGGQWEEVDLSSTGPSSPGKLLARLLQNPTGDRQTSSTFLRKQILQQDQIFGNSFVRKRRHQISGTVGALELLPVPYIEPVRSTRADKVTRVHYRPESTTSLVLNAPTTEIALTDIIRRRNPDPIDNFWGLPQMVSALRELDLDQKAVDYLRSFFTNGGTPSGILTLKGQVHRDERSRLKQMWDAMYGNVRGKRGVAVLDQDAKYETIGTRPDHLKLGESVFDISESRACSVFKVPPVLIGVRIGIMKSTYSNYASARTSFWNETLRPMYSSLDEDLTMQLAWEFGEPGEYRIRHDLSNVRDLQESTEILWARARDGYDKGLLTRNEARKIVALPPDEGGDHYKTKTSDGNPGLPGAVPKPNPEPKPAATKKPTPGKSATLSLVEEESA